MNQYKLIYPYKKVLREVITYDYSLFEREKSMLDLAGYKLAYQDNKTFDKDEHYIYIYVQL